MYNLQHITVYDVLLVTTAVGVLPPAGQETKPVGRGGIVLQVYRTETGNIIK